MTEHRVYTSDGYAGLEAIDGHWRLRFTPIRRARLIDLILRDLRNTDNPKYTSVLATVDKIGSLYRLGRPLALTSRFSHNRITQDSPPNTFTMEVVDGLLLRFADSALGADAAVEIGSAVVAEVMDKTWPDWRRA